MRMGGLVTSTCTHAEANMPLQQQQTSLVRTSALCCAMTEAAVSFSLHTPAHMQLPCAISAVLDVVPGFTTTGSQGTINQQQIPIVQRSVTITPLVGRVSRPGAGGKQQVLIS